ncbi:MAG: hypothetical protein ACPGED_07175 [Flavobacteriales bacterium]
MTTNRSELKRAVHVLLNDVVEQCFQNMIHYPQHSSELNRIIKDATDEINYLTLKIDAHDFPNDSPELKDHFKTISKDTHKKSLRLLGSLQNLQSKQKTH